MYLLLADLLVLIHFLFIVFVLLGGILLLKWKKLIWLHLPALLWGVFIQFSGWICPLTPLEIQLRRLAGANLYQGGFISHYLVPLIYPPGLTSDTQWLLGGILITVNITIYSFLFISRQKRRTSL
ncbi:putative membrane protein [hydrothermal vent metagenome]|uniref:Putative membrane protein n=1 Tax=hydrothermal vent metagenome TaxID=652676 RepID=A0A3B1AXC5_9ZZZZ